MKQLNLMVHAGGMRVDRDNPVLDCAPDPQGIWRPIAHRVLLDGVQGSLERSGLKVVSEAHAVAKKGLRYFGMLQVQNGHTADDYSLVIGLRNSNDKTFPAGLCVGSGVFVCDNLAFSGEITIARKHTTNLERDLSGLIESAVGRLGGMRQVQDERIAAYKATPLVDAQVHDLAIQCLDARVLPVTSIPDVIKEWRNPRHPEFAESKNAWRFFNACTETLKGSALFRRPAATQALHGLVDSVCGLTAVSSN